MAAGTSYFPAKPNPTTYSSWPRRKWSDVMAKDDGLSLDQIDDNDPQAATQLRDFATRAGARAARADSLERENAALRFGIDTESRLGQAWLANTTVDLTNKEAVLADAREFSPSIIRGEVPAEVVAPGSEVQATGDEIVTPPPTGSLERNALNDGATASAVAIPDVAQQSMDVARQAIEQGTSTRDQVTADFIATRALATHEGRLAPLLANGRRPTPQ
jgi:hypothetical protein